MRPKKLMPVRSMEKEAYSAVKAHARKTHASAESVGAKEDALRLLSFVVSVSLLVEPLDIASSFTNPAEEVLGDDRAVISSCFEALREGRYSASSTAASGPVSSRIFGYLEGKRCHRIMGRAGGKEAMISLPRSVDRRSRHEIRPARVRGKLGRSKEIRNRNCRVQ